MKNNDFKVLFIYPNTMMATLVPINLSILSTCLKSKGFSVDLFDTTYYRTEEKSFEEKKVELLQVKEFNLEERGVKLRETDICEDLVKKVESYQPDLIGITIVEDTYDLAISLLKPLRRFNIPVIAGGVFVTFSPQEVINNEDVDMICIGEGEEALTELCQKMHHNEDFSNVKNLWIKKDRKIIKNSMRKLTDINKLPFIDYDIFGKKRLFRPMYGKIYTMIHIEIDRGCPYNCTYCEAPQLRKLFNENGCGHYYRRKKVESIMKEIDYLVKKYKPDYINFNSETFLAKSPEELSEFARQYRKVGLPFWCQTRPETITEEKVKMLKEIGCDCLQFGIEHGNEEFRAKVLNRYCSNKQTIEGLKIVGKYKIPYTVNNIIGFPGETRELIFDTINLNRQINPRTINCYFFTPYKGTVLHKYCVENEYLDKNTKIHQLLDGAKMKWDTITYEQLKGLQRTFPLYIKMPKQEWNKIKIAERFDDEGNKMFEGLRKVYYERYF